LNKVVAKGAFLSKVHTPNYTAVHAVMYQKSSTVQEKDLIELD